MHEIFLCASFLIASLASFSYCQTDVYIGLENKRQNQESIFLAGFVPTNANQQELEKSILIRDIVRYDLFFSRYFDIKEDLLNPMSLKEDKEALNFFSNSSSYYIRAEIAIATNTLNLKGQIYNLKNKQKIFEKNYISGLSSLRKLAHFFSDDIIYKLTNNIGIATTKIAFSNDSTGKKEIYMVDYDGENLIKLTNHKSISLMPRWANDGYRLYYTTYKNRNPDIYEIDFKKGTMSPFSTYQGLNIPGGFSPDASTLALTLSKGKDPSIYLMGLKNKELKKLIDRFGVSASPTYSPDGKEIAFISDISGNPQLHIYNFETGKTRKLTRLNWTDSPNWSASGQWIVFSGRESVKEKMNIFIIDPTGSQIKRLTRNEGDNEDPSFSPDSRFICFTTTRNKKREIYIMDIDGSAPHSLIENMEGNSYTPSWSYNYHN